MGAQNTKVESNSQDDQFYDAISDSELFNPQEKQEQRRIEVKPSPRRIPAPLLVNDPDFEFPYDMVRHMYGDPKQEDEGFDEDEGINEVPRNNSQLQPNDQDSQDDEYGTPPQPGMAPCNTQGCRVCPHVTAQSVINAPHDDFIINSHFDCDSHCVVYAILCKKCPKIYIGETYRPIKERFTDHLLDVEKKRKDNEVVKHFRTVHTINDMQITVLLNAPFDDIARTNIESRTITGLGTLRPAGLNIVHKFVPNYVPKYVTIR